MPAAEALLARWPDVVGRVMRERRAPMLAAALEQSTQERGPGRRDITVRLTERNDILVRAIEDGRADVLAATQSEWPAVAAVHIALPDDGPVAGSPRRLTAEALRADQVASLRKRGAVLGAAIDALDLELIE